MQRIGVRHVFVVATFLVSLLLYVDRACISTAKDAIARDLGLSDTAWAWVMSAFALGYALFQTPTGMLSDRLGPRRVLAAVVVFWSLFTGLTAAAFNLASLLVVRFLFGAGEAGAFPGMARAAYSWFPVQERGVIQGINFSGGRIGAALALPVMALAIDSLGWQLSFTILMLLGFVWATGWYLSFRDDPAEHFLVSPDELAHIREHRQQAGAPPARQLQLGELAASPNVWLLCGQYFASNFTFFFCLTWLHPHLKETYRLTSFEAGVYSSAPFLCGAAGNWLAGWIVDRIFRSGRWNASRRWPAEIGFCLAAVGVVGCAYARSPLTSVSWLSLAVLGADMTLAPSWSVCIDTGRTSSGMVSGTMNMAGNLGSFLTSLAFPVLRQWYASPRPFFFVAAGLSALAMLVWLFINPQRPVEARS